MIKVRKQVVRGDGLTERKYEVEQLVYPVTQEEIDEYDAGQADSTVDPVWAHVAPIVEEAKRRLEELTQDPPADVFEPHVGEGWYCRQLIELGDRIGGFAFEWEVASQALLDAIALGALETELTIRREHNDFFKRRMMIRDRQSEAGRTTRRRRPYDDQHTLSRWDYFHGLSGKKMQADEETAAELGIAPRTIRDLRIRFGR